MTITTTAPETQTGRLHFMDTLRAGLMICGIPFHASLVFGGSTWWIGSQESSRALFAVGEFIHIWRMPTFFVVAGYFALLIVRRQGSKRWFKGRLKRLGIPLLFGFVAVIPAQMLILAWAKNDGWSAISAAWMADMGRLSTHWTSHLWFLIDLLVYCAALAVLYRLGAGRWVAAKTRAVVDAVARSRFLVVMAAGSVAAVVVGCLAVWQVLNLEDRLYPFFSQNVGLFGPFFFLGVVVALRPSYMQRMIAKPSLLTMVIAALTVGLYLGLDLTMKWEGSVALVLKAALLTVSAFYCARLLFALGRLLSPKPNATVRWLVDSSLVVYIVHLPFVILYGGLMIDAGANPIVGFLAVVVLAFVTSAVVYELVALIPGLRFVTMGSARPSASFLRGLRRP